MKIALVHDWLFSMRGAEKVFLELCRLFPTADVYTLLHRRGEVHPEIESHRIYPSFLQKAPGFVNHYPKFLPLFPLAIEAFDLTPYDLVISSSHCVAGGVITRPEALHISYVHSPMRYIWDMHFSYFPKSQGNVLQRILYRLGSNYLRMWDIAASRRPDKMIANSGFVAQRIRKYYRRRARVVHPPVEVEQFQIARKTENYYLAFSANVPYKRVDLVLEAFQKLRLPLKVMGQGTASSALQKRLGSHIEFLGWPADQEMRPILAQAKALVYPALDDFGIIPVEANASGVPVIAFGAGGVLDTIVPLDERRDKNATATGLFFAEQSVAAIIKAVERFEKYQACFQDRQAIRQMAFRFHPSVFRRKVMSCVVNAARQKGIDFGQKNVASNNEGQETEFVRIAATFP